MFSTNRELIPDNLSKEATFSLLEGIGLNNDKLTALDENLKAHGMFVINEITSAMIIGSRTLSIALNTNKGLGSIQFNKIERLKTIEVTYIPTSTTEVGDIQQIMRIDVSESHEEAGVLREVVENKGSDSDDQTGPN